MYKNLKEMLLGSCEQYPDRTAFRIKTSADAVKDITYTQLRDDVLALGTYFESLGLRGKHIAIISENRYEWVVSYLAAISNGTVVPIDRDLPEAAVLYLLRESDCEAVLYSQVYESIIAKSGLDHTLCFENTYPLAMSAGKRLCNWGVTDFIAREVDAEKASSIIYTSGTTGFSKGVMLSHKNIMSNIYGATSFEKYGEHETLLSVLPYHHCFECTMGLMASLTFGATICINDSLKYLGKNMLTFRPSAMYAVPAIINAVSKRIADAEDKIGRPLTQLEAQGSIFGGRLKRIYSGSAPLNTELIERFANYGVELLQGYGLTETSPVVTTTKYERIGSKNIRSVGEVIPGCEVKIKDGEILVKGDSVMLGYYKNPQATAEVFENGWFKTGDLGLLDESGFLYINGRKKNVIIASGGENVYPEEIEQLLYSVPLIADALVYGGDNPEKEIVTAVIYPNENAFLPEEVSPDKHGYSDEIVNQIRRAIDRINETLPVYKQIQNVKFRSQPFAKTTSNKIKRNVENIAA
jgi:long-chain acyl-CoA synthetase